MSGYIKGGPASLSRLYGQRITERVDRVQLTTARDVSLAIHAKAKIAAMIPEECRGCHHLTFEERPSYMFDDRDFSAFCSNRNTGGAICPDGYNPIEGKFMNMPQFDTRNYPGDPFLYRSGDYRWMNEDDLEKQEVKQVAKDAPMTDGAGDW